MSAFSFARLVAQRRLKTLVGRQRWIEAAADYTTNPAIRFYTVWRFVGRRRQIKATADCTTDIAIRFYTV